MNEVISDLFYPPLCLHCQKKTEKKKFLCMECIPFLELVEAEARCPYCFCERERRSICNECREKKRWYLPVAAALEKRGAVHTLISHLGRMPYLAKGLSGLMAVQHTHLSWPLPDYLIPLPSHFLSTLIKGRSASTLLARELSNIWKVPLLRMGRKLHFRQRVADKNLLLIGDQLDIEKFTACSEVLFSCYPRKVYALSLSY